MRLIEMATLRKKDSGLPVNIYIDDSISYKRGKHSKRIKFQTDKGDRPNTRFGFSSMTLDGNVVAKTLPDSIDIDAADITQIRNFVLNNAECLSLVADFNLDYDDFKNHLMIVGGEPATDEQKEEQKEKLRRYLNNN